MILQWMVYSVFVTLLLGLASLALEGVLRQRGLPARFAWAAGLFGALALAAVALASPSTEADPSEQRATGDIATVAEQRIAALAEVPRPLSLAAVTGDRAAAQPNLQVGSVLDSPSEAHLPREADGFNLEDLSGIHPDPTAFLPRTPGSDAWAFGLWATASSLVLLHLAVSAAGLRRRRRHWVRTSVDGRDVLLTPDIGPAVVGFFPGEIVVPGWLTAAPPAEREMALAHETEHVRRRDPLLLLAAVLACAVSPWNPALWWIAGRLRRATEIDCDQRVLARGADARAYGRLLMAVNERATYSRFAVCALSTPPSFLERRIRLMLRRDHRWSRTRVGAGLTMASTFVLAAHVTARPAPAVDVGVPPVPVVPVSLSAIASLPPSALVGQDEKPAAGDGSAGWRGRDSRQGILLELGSVAGLHAAMTGDTIPDAKILEEMRRVIEARTAGLEQLMADTTRERILTEMRAQLDATAASVAALRADTTRMRMLEEARRELSEATAYLRQMREDTLSQRAVEEAREAIAAAAEEVLRQRELIEAELQALRQRLREIQLESFQRGLELVDSLRTQLQPTRDREVVIDAGAEQPLDASSAFDASRANRAIEPGSTPSQIRQFELIPQNGGAGPAYIRVLPGDKSQVARTPNDRGGPGALQMSLRS